MRRLFLLLTLMVHTNSFAEEIYTGVKSVRYDYCNSVLSLLIAKSEGKYGQANLAYHPDRQYINSTAARNIELVSSGVLDVNCIGYNLQRKDRFLWVEPGIYMGLLGYRLWHADRLVGRFF